MKDKKINISRNLIYLRRRNHLTIEQVAGEIGVSRQAVSKWRDWRIPSSGQQMGKRGIT